MSCRRDRQGRCIVALVVAALILSSSLTSPGHVSTAFAAPSNAAIRAKQGEVAEATERIDELAAQVELASEDYFEAVETLNSIEASIVVTEKKLKDAQDALEAQQVKLGQRANAIYRQGEGSVLEVFLGVSSFQELINAFSFMQRIGESDADILVGIRATKAEIATAQEALQIQRVEQVEAVQTAADKKLAVDQKLANQKAYLAELNDDLSQLIARERARREAAARAAAAAARAGASSGGASNGPIVGGRTYSGSLGGAHPQVVEIARRFVGVTPYVWGGTTPTGFDCSGLVLYSYRQIGINLPRTSRSQYAVGDFIPADRTDLLQPGDLLFFGYDRDPSRIHHVAIYSGDGKMIHAPYTGSKVSETYLSARSDYVGATRP